MTDVLIGSIKNYGWDAISTFVISVERSGYKGEKVMFAQDIQPNAVRGLLAYGWKVMEAKADTSQHYAIARHFPILEFLKTQEYRYVMILDVRDLVLQSDPVPWLEEHLYPHELIGASECVRLRDQSTNYGNIQRALGPDIANSIGDQDVLCAGTIIGTHKGVMAVQENLLALARVSEGAHDWDQAYLNYMLRVPPLCSMTKIPKMREGFIATCSWFLSWPRTWDNLRTDESPDFDLASATVYKPGTKEPFPILHQYDRDGEWDKAIRSKYV